MDNRGPTVNRQSGPHGAERPVAAVPAAYPFGVHALRRRDAQAATSLVDRELEHLLDGLRDEARGPATANVRSTAVPGPGEAVAEATGPPRVARQANERLERELETHRAI